jgi:hypothetical protein
VLSFNDYENKLPYPDKPHRPFLGRNPSSHQAKAYALELEAWEHRLAQFDEDKAAYQAEQERLVELFWNDVAEDLGVKDHPRFGKLKEIAWDAGHSDGYQSVYNWASTLVELIK